VDAGDYDYGIISIWEVGADAC
jgi:hypothetical protein